MISTAIFDMNEVLCRYDREVRVARLARDCAKTPSFVEDAIWASGYEDLGDAGAMDIDAYLSGFVERLGGTLRLDAWIGALRAALTPLPEALDLAAAVGRRARIAVLTNNNLLVAREINSLFPSSGRSSAAIFSSRPNFARASPTRRSIAAVSPGLAQRRRRRCSLTTAPRMWQAPSKPASAAMSMSTRARWPRPSGGPDGCGKADSRLAAAAAQRSARGGRSTVAGFTAGARGGRFGHSTIRPGQNSGARSLSLAETRPRTETPASCTLSGEPETSGCQSKRSRPSATSR